MGFRFSFFVFRFLLPGLSQKFALLAGSFYQKPKTKNPKRLFQGFGFLNQHNGDIVLDLVKQAAFVADEAVTLLIEVDFPMALGAG